MTRDEEKIKAALDYIEERGYSTGQLDVAFIEGVEWADEHPNLTWEDINKIISITEQLKINWWFRDNEQTKAVGTQVFWEEVLRRYKEMKGYDRMEN